MKLHTIRDAITNAFGALYLLIYMCIKLFSLFTGNIAVFDNIDVLALVIIAGFVGNRQIDLFREFVKTLDNEK
jgi:hypothetical protein